MIEIAKSDEERAQSLAIAVLTDCALRYIEGPQSQVDRAIDLGKRTVIAALTAVRAEASAAEREAIAKWADTWVNAPVNIADALAKIAALQRDEAHIMKQYQRVSDENAALRKATRALLELCENSDWDEVKTQARAALEMSGGRSSET